MEAKHLDILNNQYFIRLALQPTQGNFYLFMALIEKALFHYFDELIRQELNDTNVVTFLEECYRGNKEVKSTSKKFPGTIVSQWSRYQESERYGVVMVAEGGSHVLVVKGFSENAGYSFPKGKRYDNGASEYKCAEKEMLEETGYTGKIQNYRVLKPIGNERLFLIPSIKWDFEFRPQLRREVKVCNNMFIFINQSNFITFRDLT